MKVFQNIPFQNWIKDKSFRINTLSENVKEETYNLGAHIHHYHEILYVKNGEGEMFIDDKSYKLESQTIYCIWQGQVHQWKHAQNRDGYAIMFKNDFLPAVDANTFMVFDSTLFNRIQKINRFQLEGEEGKYFDFLFEHILFEYSQPSQTFGQKQSMQYLIMALLVKLARKAVTMDLETISQKETSLDIFQSFLLLIEQNYQQNPSLYFYAEHLGISSRKLNDIIKHHSGETAKQLIMKRTFTEAKRLLAFTSTSLKEISYQLGFNNQAYFCSFFKKQAGVSPQKYRVSKQ